MCFLILNTAQSTHSCYHKEIKKTTAIFGTDAVSFSREYQNIIQSYNTFISKEKRTGGDLERKCVCEQ